MVPDSSRLARAGVVIPIRAFAVGKARLSGTLDATPRAELAEFMADQVLAAASRLPVVVVSSAEDVRAWGARHEVTVLDDPGDLDQAVAAGVEWWAGRGVVRVIVAHADLPRAPAGSLARFGMDDDRPIVTVVPCHRDDGTPVISVPVGSSFSFAYGPGSFRRHALVARAAGLAVRVVRDADLGFDVDVPSDLAALTADVR
ncbi:MAG: 2-phospho-L-lactate guanylyltransferase [Acidimicrobiia bacterium]